MKLAPTLWKRRMQNFWTAVTRNRHFLICSSGLYLYSRDSTKTVSDLIAATWPHAGKGRAYRRFLTNRGPQKLGVLISGMGRFGNSVIQINNAGAIASKLGATEIYYYRYDVIQNRSLKLWDSILVSRFRALRRSAHEPPPLLWKTDAIFSGGILFDPCSDKTKAVATQLLTLLPFTISPASQSRILTVHLRSGDVFGENPHPNYGQPPWAFYAKVLETQTWDEVVLVSEDQGNPNLAAIAKWCEAQNVTLRLTGTRLDETMVALLEAGNLVLSEGTFAASLALIGGESKRVYSFGSEPNPLICPLTHEVWSVGDLTGRYTAAILSRNWANSPAQRALMVDYPKSELSDLQPARI